MKPAWYEIGLRTSRSGAGHGRGNRSAKSKGRKGTVATKGRPADADNAQCEPFTELPDRPNNPSRRMWSEGKRSRRGVSLAH